ncbi:Pkinase-domain-containing protein [Rhizodiscina lignyota]|uniref:Pkinase-domain-containing protein n=1 Tax=Rhizodiscina lignyota TaxID=1504668 RepID=A0A9P4MFV4_9PEZI|nr:Pkinase-domain-containing protein [Rhizodiscina lignyota]
MEQIETETSTFEEQYDVQHQLGIGRYARVYRCVERSSGSVYAVKCFDKIQMAKATHHYMCPYREFTVMMSCKHPNILDVHGILYDDKTSYIVMEYAPEGSLFDWLVRSKGLGEARARRVFRQMCRGLEYLHEQEVIHRDIKPENILVVNKQLDVKICDFGLAQAMHSDDAASKQYGTREYMAPELIVRSGDYRYTSAVDVWASGVVLYICLCGFKPFRDELCSADFPYRTVEQIQLGSFTYPGPVWSNISDSALDLVNRMLVVNVDRRLTITGCLQHPWTVYEPLSKA